MEQNKISFQLSSQAVLSEHVVMLFERLFREVGFTEVAIYGTNVGLPGEHEVVFELVGPGADAEVVDGEEKMKERLEELRNAAANLADLVGEFSTVVVYSDGTVAVTVGGVPEIFTADGKRIVP